MQKLGSTLGAELPEDAAGQLCELRAISSLVCRRFKADTCAGKNAPERDVERLFSELEEGEDGMDAGTSTAKIWCALRLLNVAELKELQGEINDLMGAVQAFTANPKVNPSLGVVGK